jgi:ATPase family associated with various cellular activities (AAA)
MSNLIPAVYHYFVPRAIPQELLTLDNFIKSPDAQEINAEQFLHIMQNALSAEQFPNTKNFLKRTFKDLTPSDVKFLLNVMKEIPRSEERNPFEYLERFMSLLTTEQLESNLKLIYGDNFSTIQGAKEQLKVAEIWLKATSKAPLQGIFYRSTKYLVKTIHMMIEAVLNRTGIHAFIVDSNDPYAFQGYALINYVNAFLALETNIRNYLIPKTKPTAGINPYPNLLKHVRLVTIASIISLLILARGYIKYFKQDPTTIDGFQNLSDQTKTGELQEVPCREIFLPTLSSSLEESTGGIKFHTMLIGPTGAGKTSTMKGFAQAIANGEFPKLKDKQVLYINTANFSNERGRDQLQEIISGLKDRIENYIFIFDEIHTACRSRLAEDLKTYLDPGPEGIPYLIGATTDKEYYRDIYSKDPAFMRRFRVLTMNPPSQDEVIDSLNKHLLKHAPMLFLETGTITYLYEQTKKAFPDQAQPYMSCLILSQAIKSVTDFSFSEVENQIMENEQQQTCAFSKKAVEHGDFFEASFNLEGNKEKINELSEVKRREQEKLSKFYELQNQMVNAKRKLYQLTLKIAKMNPLKKNENKALIHQYLQSHQIYEAWHGFVSEESHKLEGINSHLNKNVIDQVIAREFKTRKESKEMALNARPKEGEENEISFFPQEIENSYGFGGKRRTNFSNFGMPSYPRRPRGNHSRR